MSLHTSNISCTKHVLRLLPLTFRREFLDLCMFFKCINNLYDFNIFKHATFTSVNLQYTRAVNDGLILKIPTTKTFIYQKLFFNRIVFLWNKLPYNIRCLSSLAMFKSRLLSYFINMLHTTYDCNNTCTWSMCCRCTNCRMQ